MHSRILLITGICLWLGGPQWAAGDTRDPTHDEAVELARSGDYSAALDLLATLRREAPDNLDLIYDETVILVWAGEDLRALENAHLIAPEAAPDYVIDALAKAYRNTGNFEQAIQSYERLLSRNTANIEARVGLALCHADIGRFARAHGVLDAAPEEQDEDRRLPATHALLYELEGRDIDALASYQRLLDLDPGNVSALRGKALILRRLLLPREALAIVEDNPGVLSAEEVVQLEVDVAAMELRQGEDAASPTGNKYESIDSALARIEALLAGEDVEPEVRQRLEFDRIVGLTARRRSVDAIEAFEALDMPLSQIPVYVLQSAGTAYLEAHQPDRARALLEEAVDRQPENPELKFRLFFAYTDLQRFDDARVLSDQLLADLEKTYQVPGSSVVKGSPEYLRAAILAGLVRAYADQLAESQAYFESLLVDLPNNTDIRQELANVYRWRGWTDKALEQYSQVLTVEPGFVTAQVGDAHTRLDANEFDRVESQMQALQANHGDEPSVINLARRWQIHNRYEMRIDARFGESSGATFGDEEYQIDSSWYSRPMANRYRALFRTHDAYARFPEGKTHRRRAGIGVEYRYGRLRADATVSAARDGGDAGFGLTADYRLSDVLRVGGRVEIESEETPLRGFLAGVSGNLVNVYGRYDPHESTGIGLSLTTLDLSDGNTVNAMFVSGEHRLINRPRLKFNWIADLYAAARKRNDVAYYSPKNDVSLTTGLRTEWWTYRRHGFSLSQTFTVLAGQYDQSGFSSGMIWAADYRVSLEMAEAWYIDVSARRQRSVYDGAPEYGTFLSLGLSGRF